jgi:CRP-like cAMP-binding protein
MTATRRLPTTNRSPPTNDLLAALDPADFERIAPALVIVPLTLKEFLYRPREPISHVYFPGGGFVSVVIVLEDGGMVEVATIGREGMLGTSAMLYGDLSPAAALVQAETDTCYRMPVTAFRGELNRRGPFYYLMNHYADALGGFIMQSAACNAVHSVEQRLSRWLLMAHDRVGRDDFPLRQEFVAMMLGATRPTVTAVAGTLERAGLIMYQRGYVTIVDRENLEAASCECYRTATDLLRNVTRRSESQRDPDTRFTTSGVVNTPEA